MIVIVILIVSVLIQLAALVSALRLIKLTGRAYSWIFISLALFMMMIRRVIALCHFAGIKAAFLPDLTNEAIGLILSCLMFLGIVGIKQIFIARQKAEEEAKLSAKYIHYLSKYANDIIILLDEKFCFLEVNERMENVYGYGREELIGMHASQLRSPEARESYNEQIKRTIVKGNSLYETVHQRKDGTTFPVEISLRAIEMEGKIFYQAVIRDITERKQAENELQIAHQQLLDIIEFIPDATFVIDRDKKVIAWNRALEEMTGIKKQYIIGKGDYAYSIPFYGKLRPIIIDLIGEDDPKTEAMYEKIEKHGENIHGELFVPGLYKGKGAYVSVTASPLLDPFGNRYGAIETVRDITERKEAEKALYASELKHRTLFETANDGIMLMKGDRFIDCNARALTIFGCSREDIIGAHPYEFSPPVQPDGRSSDESAFEKINRALEEKPQLFEWEHCRMDKTPFATEVSLNRMELGDEVIIQAIVRDISERKEAEKALHESERKYRELVQNANSIIMRSNAQGEITFMNEFGQGFFGYAEHEILGRPVVGTIVPEMESNGRDLRPLMKQIGASAEAFEQNINENIRRNGERVWIAWTNKTVLDQGGKGIEIFSIGTDVTERVTAEKELKNYREHLEDLVNERTGQLEKLNTELAQSNIKLQELDRLKSMFIASMSHELRTPLNSIIGFSGMTLQGLSGELNDEQKDNLFRVYQSGKHLLAMITDVIDISKIEAGRIDSFVEVCSLKDVIDEALATVKLQMQEKQLTLTRNQSVDVALTTDRKRLLQCLINLVSNAVKFTERGGITVSVEEHGSAIEISIGDTGIGIAKKDVPKLFEAFERLDTHLRIKAGGTGLGLYLTRKLATDILQGIITVRSREGEGSTFTITIPRNVHQAAHQKEQEARDENSADH